MVLVLVVKCLDLSYQLDYSWTLAANLNHREHTMLLSRERVNKGTKRMNSLPLSLVVISWLT